MKSSPIAGQVGARIRTLRLQRRLTQAQLAERAGLGALLGAGHVDVWSVLNEGRCASPSVAIRALQTEREGTTLWDKRDRHRSL